jgi:prepilin-type N-terminal cleavage/methylation domain-containing protein
MTARTSLPRGVTLLELIVTLALLGIIAGVTVLAVRRIDAPRPDDPRTIVADTLRAVLASGQTTVMRVATDSGRGWAVVRPDGSVVADSLLGVERLTGAPARAR